MKKVAFIMSCTMLGVSVASFVVSLLLMLRED